MSRLDFASALAVLLVVTSAAPGAELPRAVPTFHCLGLYWNPEGGSEENACGVLYREAGTKEWREALPLWFDARNKEYRGSIVDLTPGTTYEIKLVVTGTKTQVAFRARTWSEQFPISRVIPVREFSSDTLKVSTSGSPEGYVLFAPAPGMTATIDVAGKRDQCVEIKGSYVIIRGLTLKGAHAHGIRIYPGSHDVVIEECDISGWGGPDKLEGEKWGRNCNSAVFSSERLGTGTIERVIIQRNRMHHPRYDTNSWREERKGVKEAAGFHPAGPQAISLFNSAGNHVFRYNDVYSDEDHYYNDIFGAGSNFSTCGFPNRDSDIYCNKLSCCWDDGIEAEGGNCNVRIWSNYIDKTFVKIATASTSVGPLYMWRNVFGSSRAAPEGPYDKDSRGPLLKAGGKPDFIGGRTYVFHNTILQPPPPEGMRITIGCNIGLSGYGGPIINHVSRNNIFHVCNPRRSSIGDGRKSPTNDFDYDLYNGRIGAVAGSEKHGIRTTPKYDPNNGPGEFALAPGTRGYDEGIRIPNFNDNFRGLAPDIGAHEAGTPPMEFGVDACRPKPQKARKPERKRERKTSAVDALVKYADEIAEARRKAHAGNFEEAAAAIEAVEGAPEGAKNVLNRIARGLRATRELRRWIAEGTSQGRRKKVFMMLAGRRRRVTLLAADAAGVRVESLGKPQPVPWEEISPKDLFRIASKYAASGRKEPPAERRQLLDDFAFAYGIDPPVPAR